MNPNDQALQPDQGAAKPKKLLYVIKAKEKSSAGFESFLLNRDWDVVTTTDLKEALSAVFSRPIHCLLITVEHPNAQCLKLPGIIAQTTKTPVILFSEGLTPGGVNILRGSDHPYILAPPVSGPAIERMVLRIEKEATTVERNSIEKISAASTSALDSTVVSQSRDFSEMDFAYLFDSMSDDATSKPNSAEPIRTSGIKEFTHLAPDEEASVLDRAATAALKASSVLSVATDGTLRVLDRQSRVGCLQVESSFFTGVLVVAFPGDRTERVDQEDVVEFMAKFKTQLAGFLNAEGVEASMFEVPEFCLNEVSFEEWACADATFLRRTVHHDGEVGVSFFPHQRNDKPLRQSEDATMSRIGLQEIREDVALPFDVYLYLPVNKKYIRYAAKERFLYDSQRDRLNASGFKDVHIKRDSEKDVTRYRMQIDLNDKIRAHAEKKAA
jgi:hypothetical protein